MPEALERQDLPNPSTATRPFESLTKTVQNGGVSIATEASGTATRGAILLTMGATASMVWWPDELVKRLSVAGYLVIRFDHRDTGKSTTNPPGDVRYGLYDLVGDLLAVLDTYELQRAHFVGMSLGGYLSQIVALQQPARVQSLTLIAAEPVGIEYNASGIAPEFMEHFGKIEGLDWSDQEAVADFMLGIARLNAGSAEAFDEPRAMRRIQAELGRTQSMHSAFNHAAIAGEIHGGLTAASLKQPVLIVHGTEDPIIAAAAADTTHSVIPESRLLLLEGRGHELLAKDIAPIAQAILDLVHFAELQGRPVVPLSDRAL